MAIGGWRLVALVAVRGWRLVVGGWQLVAVGSWWLVTVHCSREEFPRGPWGCSGPKRELCHRNSPDRCGSAHGGGAGDNTRRPLKIPPEGPGGLKIVYLGLRVCVFFTIIIELAIDRIAPHSPRANIRREPGGGGVLGPRNFCTRIFPIVNIVFSHDGPFGRGGGGSSNSCRPF